MARPKVNGNSTRPSTEKIQISDRRIASPSAAPEDGSYRAMSYLSGACNTMDVGTGNPWSTVPGEDFEQRYRLIQALRRHTVEQGFATITREDFETGE